MNARSTKTADTAVLVTLTGWRDRVRDELDQRVLPFWLRHSLDGEHGGYFDHLDRDGARFDSKKHVGLQAQALWVWSRLATEGKGRPERLAAARSGAEFLRKHARRGDGRVFALLSADGRALALDSGPRNELLFAAAFAEWARACGESDARDFARSALESALSFAREPERLRGVQFPDALATSELDTVVLAIDALQSYERVDPGAVAAHERAWFARLEAHVRPELDLVLENVGSDGALIDGPEGRLVCPGRVLVAARQLFEFASRRDDQRGIDLALTTMENALDYGWDGDDGGLYLYLDRDGFSPVQIEWSRKLAWVHGAALVATATAYHATRAPRWLERFEQVADHALAHFPDAVHGEWFASLDRMNRVSQRFKAGPRKGGYSVVRALLCCDKLLGELVE